MQDEQQFAEIEHRAEEEAGRKSSRRLRSPEAIIFSLGVLCLLVVGPVRGALAGIPLLLFLATLALFMVPGTLLARLLLGRRLSGVSQIPLAFVLSTGVFGLASIPGLTLHWSFDAYLWICGAILAGFLVLALIKAIRQWPYDAENQSAPEGGFSVNALWVPFGTLTGVLAYAPLGKVHLPGDDSWIYLGYIRDFLAKNTLAFYSLTTGEEIGLFTRYTINGWLPEQALLSWVSGIDPIALTQQFLPPALVVISLLAFYSLARILFRNETAALLAGCLAALLFIVDFGFSAPTSIMAPSEDLVGRVAEDKFVTRFVFLPVALALAVSYIRERRIPHLVLFAFVCWSVAAVHPLVLAVVGFSAAGFGAVHLATNPRDKGSWAAFCSLGAAVLSGAVVLSLEVLLPITYLLVTGSPLPFTAVGPLSSTLEATGPDVSASLIEAWQEQELLLMLEDGSYIMHPSLLMSPAMLATYLVGLPFLVWRLKQSLAAQLLLGMLLFVPVLIYVPPIATFIGDAMGPWFIHRLSWPLLLAATLTLGWVIWEILSFLGSRLARSTGHMAPRIASLLPLLFVVALAAAAAPLAVAGVQAVDRSGEIAQESGLCTEDPTFRWMQDTITGPSLVLTRDGESGCVPAYAAQAKITHFRNNPERTWNNGPTWNNLLDTSLATPLTLKVIQNYEVEYVLLPVNSQLNTQLKHAPGFSRMDNPGDRYQVYSVDLKKAEVGPTITGNEHLEDGDPYAATELYAQALQGDDEDQQFLAHVGLGQLYAKEGRFPEAAQNYEKAIAFDPHNPVLYPQLAKAHESAGDQDAARKALEKGVTLFPRNVNLRTELGRLLQSTNREAAAKEYEAIAEMYPKVPEYHVQLGEALIRVGKHKAADEEFGRAISLDPRSAEVRSKIGFANQKTGRLEEAAEHYKEATKLAPHSQLYAHELGYAHFLLSVQGNRDEERFAQAEEELKRIMELKPSTIGQARGKDLRADAQLTLGDLYREWEQPEKAAAAYEEALQLDPSLEEAERKLEEVRQK